MKRYALFLLFGSFTLATALAQVERATVQIDGMT